jgi:hypothetical protein
MLRWPPYNGAIRRTDRQRRFARPPASNNRVSTLRRHTLMASVHPGNPSEGRSLGRRVRALRTCGVFLTACLVAQLLPAAAHASCGDYVMWGHSNSSGHRTAFDAAPHSEMRPLDKNAPVSRHAPAPRCHGPGCRGRSPAPLPPAPPPAPTGIEHWALLAGVTAPPILNHGFLRGETRAAAWAGFRPRIDRPPRALSAPMF